MNPDDVEVSWFSGSGAGGQYRNKHQNCCRLLHKPTGLRCVGQRERSREKNLADAMMRLAAKVRAHLELPDERRAGGVVVRTYHLERGVVTDHATEQQAAPGPVLDGHLERFTEHPDRGTSNRRSGRA